MKTIEEILAFNVFSLRKAARLSQGQLASKAKISLHTVFRIEKGKPNPETASVDAIARALGVTKEDLYARPVTDLARLGSPDYRPNPPPETVPYEELNRAYQALRESVRESVKLEMELDRLRAENEALKSRLASAAPLLEAYERAGQDMRDVATAALAVTEADLEDARARADKFATAPRAKKTESS